MDLNRRGRDYYQLDLTTTPAATGWKASFNKGTTWVEGQALDGLWVWLVAGPDYSPAAGDPASYVVVPRTVDPLLLPEGSSNQNPFVGPGIFLM